MTSSIHQVGAQNESHPAGHIQSKRVRITKKSGHLNLEDDCNFDSESGTIEGETITEEIWSNYGVKSMRLASRLLTGDRLRQIALPQEIIESHFLTELYRPHAFPALLAEEVCGLIPEEETKTLSLPVTAGTPRTLKRRFASIGRTNSRWRGWAGLAAAIPTVSLSLVRRLFTRRSTKIGPPEIDWVAAVFGGKGNHTSHVWNWMTNHRDVPVLILGHKPLDRELRRKAKASGIRIYYPMHFSDLPGAVIRLVELWPSILALHSQVERDLGIRSNTLFHARAACWFLRGFLHEAWVETSPTRISKGVIFGLIAHVDTRIAERAFRSRRIPTIHWLHGIAEDALHFRANCSTCLCVTPNDVRVRDQHGSYGQCLSPALTNGTVPTAKVGGKGLLLVTNLLHPDNRFADYGAKDHLRALLEITAACREKGESITWRPHPRESDTASFRYFSRLAASLGMRIDNHTPFKEQLANCRRAISIPSTTIGDLAAAGIVPAIFDGLPFESSGHLKRLPSELTFKNVEDLETTFRILEDDGKRQGYLDTLLNEYPVNRPIPDIIYETEIPSTQTQRGVTQLSIVTPSFKQLNFLKFCAASVRDQTGDFEVEHLIHDGGSGEEFEQWAASQRGAVCVSETDDGMYDAINRGFRKAKGDIIAWLNCDEQYLPGTLERVARYFEAHPETDILFGDVILTDELMTPLAYRRAVMPSLGHIRHSHLSTFSAATFVRRRVLDEGHYLHTRWKTIADAVWIEELLMAGYQAAVLHEPLAIFCMLGSNLGQSPLLFQERREWENELGATNRWQRQWYIMKYRLARLWVGAYWLRKVAVSAYAPGEQKRLTKTHWVAGQWKVAKNKAANLRSWRDGTMGGGTTRQHRREWSFLHALCLLVIAISMDRLTQGDAVKGPFILLLSLLFLSFRARLDDLIKIAFFYFLTSWYVLSERPVDVLIVRLGTFSIGAILAIFWSASLRNLQAWISGTVTLIRRIPVPLILTDRLGQIILVNNAACSCLQRTEQSLLNKELHGVPTESDKQDAMLSAVRDWGERPPVGLLKLGLEGDTQEPLGNANVFVVGQGRYRFYAFMLKSADEE